MFVHRPPGIRFDPAAPVNSPAVTPAPPAGPGAQNTPADNGASPAPGSAAPSPGASPQDSPNIRQLREQYETLKGQHEPWQRLNAKPEEVQQRLAVFQNIEREALELGEQLGYDAAEVKEFLGKDPVQVLAHLRQQAQSAQPKTLSPQELKKQLDRLVEDRLKPITEREEARLVKEAAFKFDGEFDRLFKDNFKDGLPDEAREAIYEMVGQMVGDDAAACKRLKFEGQVSDVAKYFDQAKTRFLKVMNSYVQHERKRTGTGDPQVPNGQKPSSTRMDAKLSTGQTVKELFNI